MLRRLALQLIEVSCFLLLLGIASVRADEGVQIQATILAGPAFPSAGLPGNFTNGGYGLSRTGYGIAGKLTFTVPAFPFEIVSIGSFQRFTGDGTFQESIGPTTQSINYHEALQIATVGIGVEYEFLPTSLLSPYIEGSGFLALVDGTMTFDQNASNYVTTEMKQASRFGIALGAGTRIHLADIPSFVLELSGRYSFANLIGKKPRDSSVVWDLADEGSSSYQQNDRTLNFFVLAIGIGFTL